MLLRVLLGACVHQYHRHIQLWKKSPLTLMAQNQNDILDMFWRLQCLKDSLLIKGIASNSLNLFQCEACFLYCRFNHLSCHANIVQRVKTCYKIKIDSRVLDCCFCRVLLCKQHPSLTIAPLLQSNSATIRV